MAAAERYAIAKGCIAAFLQTATMRLDRYTKSWAIAYSPT